MNLGFQDPESLTTVNDLCSTTAEILVAHPGIDRCDICVVDSMTHRDTREAHAMFERPEPITDSRFGSTHATAQEAVWAFFAKLENQVTFDAFLRLQPEDYNTSVIDDKNNNNDNPDKWDSSDNANVLQQKLEAKVSHSKKHYKYATHHLRQEMGNRARNKTKKRNRNSCQKSTASRRNTLTSKDTNDK